jgi:predicted glycosyltransferase
VAIVERARADFNTLLANCRLSVSQAGYNTISEAMQARARVVAVPFAEGDEVEQTLRARCFSERGLLEMVEAASLSPLVLARAVDQAAARPRPEAVTLDLNGARRSAALVADWAGAAA